MDKVASPTEIEHSGSCVSDSMARAIRLLGDTWTLMIIHSLMSGTKRFGALLEGLGNVSPKTVSQRLKKLEELGFVKRRAYAEIPPRVEYCLTDKGRALVDILTAIQDFGERYLPSGAQQDAPETVCPSSLE
ncbi:MAG: helix-turn-helix transcriptional regulator [Chloroflexota bacterium]|nr:helix-turn-helix transcriptional regulator [Chloroflexota bacterium]